MAPSPRFLAVPSSEGTKVRRLTESCLGVFAECFRIEGLSSEHIAWLEDCQARLRWWSFGLHVQSSGRASLDYRLAQRPDIRDVVSGLLSSLAATLNDCLAESRSQPVGTTDDSDGLHSDASSPVSVESSLSAASKGEDAERVAPSQGASAHNAYFIEACLRRLMRLSTLIRKSGDKFRHKRADDDLKRIQKHAPAIYSEFQAHLETLILIGPYELSLLTRLTFVVARNGIPQSVNIVVRAWICSRLGPVQKRLVQANIIRRHRIMCSRKGGRQVSSVSSQPKPAPRQAAITATASSAHPREHPRPTETAADRLELAPSVPAIKLTGESSVIQTATAIDADLKTPTSAVRSIRASSVVSRLTRTGQNQDYPKSTVLERSPLCPYCGVVLDLEYARNQKKWQ